MLHYCEICFVDYADNHPQRTYCVRPQKPAHGFIQSYPAHKRRFAPTEYVMYSCKPGFVLHGPYKVICRERAWSANPTCIRKLVSDYYFQYSTVPVNSFAGISL